MSVARFQCFRTDRQRVRWRLLGGNNRVLGISVRAFQDHAATLDEVERVRRQVASAAYEIDHVPGGQWWWRMSLEGKACASSAHGFARRVDAVLASGRFRRAVTTATTDLPLAVFQPGRRGREIPLVATEGDQR